MEMPRENIEERNAATAFTWQSGVFDRLYGNDKIIQYKRRRVREHLLRHLKEGSNVLELNSGTGEDAVFLAEKGFRIHATDISAGMQQQLVQKINSRSLAAFVTNERCSYTELELLKNRGPYDHIFSNFAGLNCTGRLDKVLSSFNELLKPGGMVTMVILPRFCLWEALLVFKGKFSTASRRFFAGRGRTAKIDGKRFKCWYYSPRYVVRQLRDSFELVALEGLCTIVPPSYLEGFADKCPKLFSFLCRVESRLKEFRPWRSVGDYYIISLKKV